MKTCICAFVLLLSGFGSRGPVTIPRVTVHTFTQAAPDEVNMHWIETPDGIIIVDALRLLSEARRALAEIQKAGKPVLALFVTHPHTDHFGGVQVFKDAYPGAVIYASQATHLAIQSDTYGYVKNRQKQLGDDFPARPLLPEKWVRNGDELNFGGLKLTLYNLPHNESESTTLIYLPDHRVLFTGDLVNHGFVPLLSEAGSQNWLQHLDFLSERFPALKTIYLGHGPSGEPEKLIEQQKEYILFFRQLVRTHLTGQGSMAGQPVAAIVETMAKRYPHLKGVAGNSAGDIIRLNVRGLWQEMQREP